MHSGFGIELSKHQSEEIFFMEGKKYADGGAAFATQDSA
jgi:hypothetical protein